MHGGVAFSFTSVEYYCEDEDSTDIKMKFNCIETSFEFF